MERFSVGAQLKSKKLACIRDAWQMIERRVRLRGEGSCERCMGSQRVHLSTAADDGTANGGELRT